MTSLCKPQWTTGITPPSEVFVLTGSAFELSVSLLAYVDERDAELFDERREWRTAAHRHLTSEAATTIASFADREWLPWAGLHRATLRLRERTPEALLAAVEAEPASELVAEMVAVAIAPKIVVRSITARALRTERGRRELLHELAALPDAPADALEALLSIPPGETKAKTLEILRLWTSTVFAAEGGRLVAAAERSAERLVRFAEHASFDSLVLEATGGVRLVPDGQTNRIILVPSMTAAPRVMLSYQDDTLVVFCPVADPDEDATRNALLKVTRALGDDTRLRLLLEVAAAPVGLQELSDRLGLAKSTTHHHLVLLRGAGCIVSSVGADRRYSIRPDLVDHVTSLVTAYLSKNPHPPG